jgi:signal transduction histidine kinase
MKEEFIAVVSHELRTPLTSIRGSLGLVVGGAVGPLPAAAENVIRIALDNSDRLTRLINDILDLERIGAGTVPMDSPWSTPPTWFHRRSRRCNP